MQIVRRIDFVRRGRGGPADQIVIDDATVHQRFYLGQPMRPITGADHPDMGIADVAVLTFVIKKGNAGESEVTLAAREFSETPTPIPRPRRQVQLRDDLVGL